MNNLNVFGPKTAGGLIGYINKSAHRTVHFYECDADKLKVDWRTRIGWISWRGCEGANFNLDGKVTSSENVAVKLISVGILSNLTGGDGGHSKVANNDNYGFTTKKNRAFHAGGVIGRSKTAITINDIDVGVFETNYSGFIGNTDSQRRCLERIICQWRYKVDILLILYNGKSKSLLLT